MPDGNTYEVINLESGESHGKYGSLDQARGCVSFDGLTAYQIWNGDRRVEECDPYLGDDDRIRQALGEPLLGYNGRLEKHPYPSRLGKEQWHERSPQFL